MRVISGLCKGRPLKPVPGKQTRPTTDKVKETIFNIIGPYFNGGKGLDLFAGSGGLGIEALSRGLDNMIFVDRDRKAVQTVKENLKACGFEQRGEVYINEAERALKAINKRGIAFDCIFLDPPYKKQKLADLLQTIDQNQLLQNGGLVVCEHSSDIVLPDQIGSLYEKKKGDYGIIGLTIYESRRQEGEEF